MGLVDVTELGCGFGYLTSSLVNNFTTLGVDVSRSAIEKRGN